MSSMSLSYSELDDFQPYDRPAFPTLSFFESGLFPRQGEEDGDTHGDKVLGHDS